MEDQRSVAFLAEIIEEAQEYGGNWDAVVGPEDVILQDPVEDLTQKKPFWMMLISLDYQRMNQKDVGLGVNFPSVSGLLCVGCTGLSDTSPSR